MLYWLFFEILFPHFSPLRIFGYVTFRTAAASITALAMGVLLGPWVIERLRRLSIQQYIRDDGPETHQHKAGTPTMGGVLILMSIIVPTLLFTNLRNPYVWLALFALAGFGAVGFADDYIKVTRARNLGLRARQKMTFQVLLVLGIGIWLVYLQSRGLYSTRMNVPFFKGFRPDLIIDSLLGNPWTYALAFLPFLAFMWLVIVGASNAVNLTDGLDGLAAGLMVVAAGAMTVLIYVSGHARFASYLDIERLSDPFRNARTVNNDLAEARVRGRQDGG